MARILGYEVTPRTWGKTWALAFANTGRGFVEMFSVPRLWIGIGVSVAIHALFFLFTSGVFTPKGGAEEGEYELEYAVVDESLPPKAQKLLQQQTSSPLSFSTTQESEIIDLETKRAPTQAQIRSDEEFDLSYSAGAAGSDVIRINESSQLSTKDILNEATISLKKSTHAYGGTRFEALAAGGGPAFDLKSATTGKIGEAEVIKTPESQTSGKDIAEKVGSGPTQSFDLSGDLTVADILRKQLPQYPSWAKEKGFSKVRIIISFSVDASGTVQPTMVVRTSSGYTQWDNQVKQALRGWKFKEAQGPVRKGQITFWFILQ
ncbi:TonB family protein [candidate division WOR-3 bacterium]|nr:TonB family protein [candidate division WOR-3 bacterium]